MSFKSRSRGVTLAWSHQTRTFHFSGLAPLISINFLVDVVLKKN